MTVFGVLEGLYPDNSVGVMAVGALVRDGKVLLPGCSDGRGEHLGIRNGGWVATTGGWQGWESVSWRSGKFLGKSDSVVSTVSSWGAGGYEGAARGRGKYPGVTVIRRAGYTPG